MARSPLKVTITQRGGPWSKLMKGHLSRAAKAGTQAARETALDIKRKGDADIAAAGNFGPRWKDSLKVEATPRTGALLNNVVTARHDIPYADIHETGGTIYGKPLLWIPLSFNEDITKRMRARDWGRANGGLFRVTRKGKNPLLFSIRGKEPLYVGVKQVTLRKRFHLTEIVTASAKAFPGRYVRAFLALKG